MNYRRSFIAMLAASPFVALLGWGMTRDPREIPSPLPGRVAPAFDLAVFARGDMTSPDATLDTVRLADHRGQVVVLNYWASWCLACRDEHRALSDVAAEYNAAGVRDVSFYVDAALTLALLSFAATLVAARYLIRGRPF